MMPMIEQQSKQLGLNSEQSKELIGIYKDWFLNDIDHASVEQSIATLSPSTSWGQRIGHAFNEHFSALGGKNALRS